MLTSLRNGANLRLANGGTPRGSFTRGDEIAYLRGIIRYQWIDAQGFERIRFML